MIQRKFRVGSKLMLIGVVKTSIRDYTYLNIYAVNEKFESPVNGRV